MFNFSSKITIKICQIVTISPVNNAVLLHAWKMRLNCQLSVILLS